MVYFSVSLLSCEFTLFSFSDNYREHPSNIMKIKIIIIDSNSSIISSLSNKLNDSILKHSEIRKVYLSSFNIVLHFDTSWKVISDVRSKSFDKPSKLFRLIDFTFFIKSFVFVILISIILSFPSKIGIALLVANISLFICAMSKLNLLVDRKYLVLFNAFFNFWFDNGGGRHAVCNHLSY